MTSIRCTNTPATKATWRFADILRTPALSGRIPNPPVPLARVVAEGARAGAVLLLLAVALLRGLGVKRVAGASYFVAPGSFPSAFDDPPRFILLPSGNSMSRELARNWPSFA